MTAAEKIAQQARAKALVEARLEMVRKLLVRRFGASRVQKLKRPAIQLLRVCALQLPLSRLYQVLRHAC